jgi:acetylornithine/succinyldiaminopimelate/putrescine aminotransferase/predicted amino acid dehydrogenase
LRDEQGRRFLDFYSQYGAVALGHNAPALRNALLQALHDGLPAMVQPYRARYAERLVDELARCTGMERCLLTSSGAETVEAAIKLARARTRRPRIVAADGSYHGKTLGALAATGQSAYRRGFGPLPPGFEFVPYGDIGALTELLQREANDVAAVLLEPIQGERGVILPPPGYLRAVRELCSKHDVLLILDEIQSGLGRTGALLAADHERVGADIVLLAKALGGGLFPLGALLCRATAWDEGFALHHSSTFANNNLACRVGLAVLSELQAGGLCQAAQTQGRYLARKLAALSLRYPTVVAAVRGRGLLQAVELQPSALDQGFFFTYFGYQGLLPYVAAAAAAERSSVLFLPSLGSTNVLRLAPPLVVTCEHIDHAVQALDDVCRLLAAGDSAALARAIGATDSRHAGTSALRLPRVKLPLPAGMKQPTRPSYAFLLHYTDPGDVLHNDPPLAVLRPEELHAFTGFAAALPAGLVLQVATVRSAAGAEADGFIIALPMLPEHMARVGRTQVSAEIERAVELAAALGAQVVGLGGFLTPYSRRGLAVTGRGPSITTGNTLTALMALRAIESLRGGDWRQARVAIVGARGSVGALCARLLARKRPERLLLVGNPDSDPEPLRALAAELCQSGASACATTSLLALRDYGIVLAASGASYPLLDKAALSPGTLICDVARPFAASPQVRARGDLTVIDGGLVALPDRTLRLGLGNLQGLPAGVQLSCLSETMLLALAGVQEDTGVGDDIPLDTADRVAALAQAHGFSLAAPLRDGQLYAPPARHRSPPLRRSALLPSRMEGLK